MMSFALLSPLVRAIFALWGLLLCLTDIGSAVLAAVKKRYRFTALAVLLFAPAYLLWQIIFDFSLFGGAGITSALTRTLCEQPWLYWLIAFGVLTLSAALLFGRNIQYDRTFITPGTIKQYLDKVPCGICCWRKNGQLLFSNICMNELCQSITQAPLLNGNQFYEAVKKGIHTVNGKVWQFASRAIESDGEELYEMIATNITAQYARTAALERDKAELSRLNKEMQAYYLSIDESVKRLEILQAKMNIHDEMNRLMLSTMAADKADTEALNRIFSLWEQNALMLCMEADKKTAQRQSGALAALADALGIRLIWQEDLTALLSEKQNELFFCAAQEALVNAVKHADAKEMRIFFDRKGDTLTCRFVNNGRVPQGKVTFEGGLANLAELAKKQNAALSVEADEAFTLVLHFV